MKQPVFVILLQVVLAFLVPVSQALATTYPGYTGTTINDGIRLNGLITAPFPDSLQVNTFDGNLYHKRIEEIIPGRGLPIEISLSYNTLARLADTPYGVGWRFFYNVALFEHANGDISVIWGDGLITRFTKVGVTFASPPGVFSTLEEYSPGKFLVTTKRGMKFFFDAPHKMVTCMKDPSGNALIFIYNGSNLLITITEKHFTSTDCTTSDATGRSVTLTYNGNNKLASITDPASRTWSYTHDASGRITTVTDPLSNVTIYSYDSVHRLTGITDARGNTITITYANFNDFSGGTISRNGTTWSFTRNAATLTYIVTDTLGRQTRYTYDSPSTGRIIRVTDALGNNSFYSWDSSNNLTQFIDRNGRITNFTYDTKGNVLTRTEAVGTSVQRTTTFTYELTFSNVTSMTEASGIPDASSTNFTYNAQGLLTGQVVDPGGLTLTTTHAYDAFGQRTSTTNPRSFVTTSTYNTNGDLTSQTIDPGGLNLVTSFTYDTVGNQVSTTDANGHVACNQYDVLNRLTQVKRKVGGTNCALTAPADVVTAYTYDAVGNRLTETDPKGNTTTFTYDAFNRVSQATYALGNQAEHEYNSVGNRIKVTDANNEVTCFKYDALNRLTQTIRTVVGSPNVRDTVPASINCASYVPDADDTVTSFSYDAVGNQLSITDPNGNTSTSTYDALNRVITQANALGETTSYTYDRRDNQKTITVPGGNVTTNIYDKADRLITGADSVGTVSTFTYDANSHRLTFTDGNGNTTTYAYDAADRLISITDPLGNSTTFTYDGVGNQLIITDRNGQLTCFIYDDLNRMFQTIHNIGDTSCSIDSNDIVSTYTYDKNSNLTIITDAKGHTTSYTYDALNRLTKETYADSTTRSFGYDSVGNILTRLDQNGNTTSYVYDDLYRLTLRDYPGPDDETFTYDKASRMITASNINAIINYTYDAANRTQSETLNAKTNAYSYDIPNRERTITYPGGKVVTENMDLRSRLDTITTLVPTTIVDYTYDAGDRVITRTYPINSTSANFTYTSNNLVTTLSHSGGIANFDYSHDNEGNRKFQKKNHRLTNSEQYFYDDIYRLTTFKEGTLDGTNNIPAPLTQTQYNYDGVGNRTTTNKDATITTYTVNNMNEYTSINGAFPLHDTNGNLIDDGTKCLYYDFENRLIQVNTKTGPCPALPPPTNLIAQYKYDPLDRRIEKNVDTNGDGVLDTITRFFFDEDREIEERNGADVVQATYVFGSWIDEVLTMDRSGTTYFYHQNSLGSVTAVTDGTGTVVERYEYDSYGKVTVLNAGYTLTLSSSAIGNPIMFTGRRFDQETGFYYYRARYYDPMHGRFIHRDFPITTLPTHAINDAHPRGRKFDERAQDFVITNLYSYVNNNPIFWVDPTGRIPAVVPVIIGLCGVAIGIGNFIQGEVRARNALYDELGTICGFTNQDTNWDGLSDMDDEFQSASDITLPIRPDSNIIHEPRSTCLVCSCNCDDKKFKDYWCFKDICGEKFDKKGCWSQSTSFFTISYYRIKKIGRTLVPERTGAILTNRASCCNLGFLATRFKAIKGLWFF